VVLTVEICGGGSGGGGGDGGVRVLSVDVMR